MKKLPDAIRATRYRVVVLTSTNRQLAIGNMLSQEGDPVPAPSIGNRQSTILRATRYGVVVLTSTNRQLAIGNLKSHPLPRGGTDLNYRQLAIGNLKNHRCVVVLIAPNTAKR